MGVREAQPLIPGAMKAFQDKLAAKLAEAGAAPSDERVHQEVVPTRRSRFSLCVRAYPNARGSGVKEALTPPQRARYWRAARTRAPRSDPAARRAASPAPRRS